MSIMARRFRTILALLPSLTIAIVLALAGLVVVRQIIPADVLRPANDVVGNYLQTVGSVYAVLLAFVVYVVWSQFNEARNEVEREANEVMDLFRTSKGFPEGPRRHLQDHLKRYTQAVLHKEWGAMGSCEETTVEEVGALLDETWEGLKSFEPQSGCHGALYTEALSRFNDLSDLRTARLTSARTRIPFAMRLLLYFGAVIVVGSMWLFSLDSLGLHLLITGAMAGAVSHVLYIIDDLDNCYTGDWQVSPAPFERVLRYIDKHQN